MVFTVLLISTYFYRRYYTCFTIALQCKLQSVVNTKQENVSVKPNSSFFISTKTWIQNENSKVDLFSDNFYISVGGLQNGLKEKKLID